MATLKHIGVFSFARIMAIISFVVLTIFFIMVGTLEWSMNSDLLRAQGYRLRTYGALTIALIAFYTFLVFVFSSLGAWLFNRFTERFGGVEIEIEEKKKR